MRPSPIKRIIIVEPLTTEPAPAEPTKKPEKEPVKVPAEK